MSKSAFTKRQVAACRAFRSGISAAVVFSKRRNPSPRKLEPHEVIAKLKARKTGAAA